MEGEELYQLTKKMKRIFFFFFANSIKKSHQNCPTNKIDQISKKPKDHQHFLNGHYISYLVW